MFEISFGEIVLIGMVALIVLGPERLPTVARTLGALVGRMQRFVSSVKADMHEQAAATGLVGLQQDIRQAADTFRNQVQTQVGEVQQALHEGESEIRTIAGEATAPLADAQAQLQAQIEPVPAAELDPQALIDAAHRDDDVPEKAPADEQQPDLFESTPSVRTALPTPSERR